MNNTKTFSIFDLAESKEFAEFFTIIQQITGIVVGLRHPNGDLAKLLCPETDYNPICQCILASPEGKVACDTTNKFYCGLLKKCKHGLHYFCHAGLIDFVVPIYIENWHIATINCGQLLPEKPSEKGFKGLCEKIKDIPVDIEELRKAYFQATYMPPDKLKWILRLISFFADYFCEVGCRLHSAHQVPQPHMTEAIRYLEENFREDISLAEIASSVGLCETYFSRLFSKTIGIPYTHYLINLRLGEAKKLLQKTDWTVTKIATDVGFKSLPYFNLVFRKSEKCSPIQYRKQFALGQENNNS